MVNDFSLLISCGKNLLICLAFLEKRTGETAWMVGFVNSYSMKCTKGKVSLQLVEDDITLIPLESRAILARTH